MYTFVNKKTDPNCAHPPKNIKRSNLKSTYSLQAEKRCLVNQKFPKSKVKYICSYYYVLYLWGKQLS